MTELQRNPHKAAWIAMLLWSEDYAAQGGGSMDFWDKLRQSDKKWCRVLLE